MSKSFHINDKKLKKIKYIFDKKIPILDVIKRLGVKIQKSSTAYKIVCIYHEDKNPSLAYLPHRGQNFVYCFVCQTYKYPVELWMDYTNKVLSEAIVDLAPMINFDLNAYTGNPTKEELLEDEIIAINKEIAQYLNDEIKYCPAVMEYVQKRFTTDSINKWQIGYCKNGNGLMTHLLKKKKFSFNAVKAAGVKENLFHDHVIFPIRNVYNSVVGFSARVWGRTPDEEKKKRQKPGGGEYPKYMNTYTTKVFQKSEQLFGLNIARDAIKTNNKTLIVVEGHPDVIAMHQKGFSNTVGIMSTAFNAATASTLCGLNVRKLIFCLDGDRAGRENTLRIMKLEKQINVSLKKMGSGIRFYAIAIPWGQDPDDYLRDDENVANMKKLLRNPMSCIDFYVHNELRNNTPVSLTDKLDFIYNLKQSLSSIITYAELSVTSLFLRETLGISELELREYVREVEYKSEVFKIENGIIAALVKDVAFREFAMEIMQPNWFQGNCVFLFRVIEKLYKDNDLINATTVIEKLKYLGYFKFFKTVKAVMDRLDTVIENPYEHIYELRMRSRKKVIFKELEATCVFAKNTTEQELIQELKRRILIFEAQYS